MDLFHNISLLYSFVSTSLVHAKYEDFRGPTNGLELQRLSETRWVCHNVRVNLQSIIDTLNYFADSSANVDANRRSEARGLLSFMDTCFVAELCILEEVLAKQKTLHLALQLETVDLPAATLMVQASIVYCGRELSGGFASEGWAQVWGASTIYYLNSTFRVHNGDRFSE